MKNRHG